MGGLFSLMRGAACPEPQKGPLRHSLLLTWVSEDRTPRCLNGGEIPDLRSMQCAMVLMPQRMTTLRITRRMTSHVSRTLIP